MTGALQLVTTAGFAALMATAAVEDVRRLVIPNRLILGLLLLWPVHLTVASTTLLTGVEAAGGAVGIFLCGALLFSRGLVGGGDVKLLTAAALWVGFAGLPALLLVTALIGGALSLVLLTPQGGQVAAALRGASEPHEAVATGAKAAVPYGAAIAGAALIVTLPAQWS
jgi:prepilin peptidase CpaA